MFTIISEIRDKLPKGYTKEVSNILKSNNLHYSVRTIQAVASGARNNHSIIKAIIQYYKSLSDTESDLNSL